MKTKLRITDYDNKNSGYGYGSTRGSRSKKSAQSDQQKKGTQGSLFSEILESAFNATKIDTQSAKSIDDSPTLLQIERPLTNENGVQIDLSGTSRDRLPYEKGYLKLQSLEKGERQAIEFLQELWA